MSLRIYPSKLQGVVTPPASKSAAHRHLICAALADGPSHLVIRGASQDIEATVNCLAALGASIVRQGDLFIIQPIKKTPPSPMLNCGESGSTLRFLLPVAAALGTKATFTGHGSLPGRPNGPLLAQLRAHGVALEGDALPLSLRGRLEAGRYELPGDMSSQFVTGLLLALPRLDGTSRLTMTSKMQSAGYVDLTLSILSAYGVAMHKEGDIFHIPAPQTFQSGCHGVEGDWSAAAFWLAAATLGHRVEVLGLNADSQQGDREIAPLLARCAAPDGVLRGMEIDASDIPDLVPILAVVATQAQGVTRICNAQRLRLKESDRLRAMSQNLAALGADIAETQDGLLIRGKTPLHGGKVDAFGDHRIAMAMAVAATVASSPTVLCGSKAVAKSYPAFFEDFAVLGGKIEAIPSA